MSRPRSTLRNGSEFPVLNGTESRSGRPPVLGDEELLGLARSLSEKTGHAPRADALISAAGGCQRKRALQAIRQLREEQARRELASRLTLPMSIEQHLRVLMNQWLALAADQLAAEHAERTAKLAQREDACRAQLEERREAESLLRQQVQDRDRMVAELTQRLTRLERDYTALNQSHIAIASIAEERKQLLDRLHGTPS